MCGACYLRLYGSVQSGPRGGVAA